MANVPMIESGTATPGIKVAEMFRRKRKITSTTRQMVSVSVNLTSWMESRMDVGIVVDHFQVHRGRNFRTEDRQKTPDVVHHLNRVGARLALHGEQDRTVSFTQARILSFSTSSRTLPNSSSRTGLPFR